MKKLFLLICCYCTFLTANAQVIIFGDSSADEGRVYERLNYTHPPAPFYEGRYSNGLLWTEYAFDVRENYAWAGAKSDRTNLMELDFGDVLANTGLLAQVEEYLDNTTEPLTGKQFYIVIGGNDFFAPIFDDNAEIWNLIHRTVDNIMVSVDMLADAGATDIVVFGLPDMALLPDMNTMSWLKRKLISRVSWKYNTKLQSELEFRGFDFYDMDAFFADMVNNPDAYGLTNVTDKCFDVKTGEVCDNPDGYLFWDNAHETTYAHSLLADDIKHAGFW